MPPFAVAVEAASDSRHDRQVLIEIEALDAVSEEKQGAAGVELLAGDFEHLNELDASTTHSSADTDEDHDHACKAPIHRRSTLPLHPGTLHRRSHPPRNHPDSLAWSTAPDVAQFDGDPEPLPHHAGQRVVLAVLPEQGAFALEAAAVGSSSNVG